MRTTAAALALFGLLASGACGRSDEPKPPAETKDQTAAAVATTEAPAPFHQEAVWSPDGDKLLLSRFEGERYRIYRIAADGSGLKQLTDGPDYWASWSPDGASFVFHSRRDGNGEIYVADAQGANPRNLTRHEADDTTPAWSPDGAKIAFVSDRDGENELYVMSSNGSNPTRLTRSPGAEYNPAWSPDSTRLLCFVTDAGSDWLTLMDANGEHPLRLNRGIFPAWSADGTRVLYDRDHAAYSCALDGSDERKLLDDAFALRASPDGARLSFIRGNWPSSEVWLCGPDGEGAQPLTGR